MKNKIYITDNCKNSEFKLSTEQKNLIKKTINACLKHEKIDTPCEISVTFVDNKEIHSLNLEHRQKDCPTDVLSFPLFEKSDIVALGKTENCIAIGDIVISVEKAIEQANEFGHSFEREICFLAAHSVFHLVGYDHEVSAEDEKYMNDSCEIVLNSIGLSRDNIADKPVGSVTDIADEPEILRENMRTGFICILGRPNVGKSTLMNTILGEKVAIVSKKPQTTRNKITGVYTTGNDQYVFIDTPGIHKPKNKLGEYMMKEAGDSTQGADAIVFIVEPTEKPSKTEIEIAQKINSMNVPTLLVINKADAFKKSKILVTIDKFKELCNFNSIIPISALQNDGVDIVLKELSPFLKNEPWYFESDMITDQPVRQIASEIIREKLLRTLDEEIPHGTAVVIEAFEEKKNIINIRAEIYCEKEAHKKIIIGKNGVSLKKIATFAREDLEKLFDKKVFLDVWVKVRENWRDSMLNLNRLGFKNEK